MPTVTTEQDADTIHRTAAAAHVAYYSPLLPGLLGNMPTPTGTPADVHAALDLLRSALEETGAAAVRQDVPGHPARMYGAACGSYSRFLALFLFEHEPRDPLRAAVLFVTFTAAQRDRLTASTPPALAFLTGADAGTLTPAAAHAALNAFPDGDTLACFLGAHHAFSLAVEALADPTGTDPRDRLRDGLEALRKGVQFVTPGRVSA